MWDKAAHSIVNTWLGKELIITNMVPLQRSNNHEYKPMSMRRLSAWIDQENSLPLMSVNLRSSSYKQWEIQMHTTFRTLKIIS